MEGPRRVLFVRYHPCVTSHPLRVQDLTIDGHPGLMVDRGGPRAVITTDVGPRILSMTLPDGTGTGLLASLPELHIERSGWPKFQLHGGHRLWAGPEVPETTYLPDAGPVEVEQAADRVSCSYLEPETGIRRTMGVAPTADSVVVDHRLVNEGRTPVDVAPWAITMCTPGGEAWVPRPVGAADPHGVLPNGSLVTWPYTRLSDDRLVLDDPILRVRAVAGAASPCKVGVAGAVDWIAYRLGSAVLIKRVRYIADATYPDLGASIQCYSGGDFLEIETLGPLVTLGPAETIHHVETWSLRAVDPAATTDELLQRLGLDRP
jgi:hypothetical protein